MASAPNIMFPDPLPPLGSLSVEVSEGILAAFKAN